MLAWSHSLPFSNNHLFLFQSMLNFLNDPTGEMPWEEEEGTEDIRHVKTGQVSNELLGGLICCCVCCCPSSQPG